jgi:hypothetical protein
MNGILSRYALRLASCGAISLMEFICICLSDASTKPYCGSQLLDSCPSSSTSSELAIMYSTVASSGSGYRWRNTSRPAWTRADGQLSDTPTIGQAGRSRGPEWIGRGEAQSRDVAPGRTHRTLRGTFVLLRRTLGFRMPFYIVRNVSPYHMCRSAR